MALDHRRAFPLLKRSPVMSIRIDCGHSGNAVAETLDVNLGGVKKKVFGIIMAVMISLIVTLCMIYGFYRYCRDADSTSYKSLLPPIHISKPHYSTVNSEQ